MPFRFLKAAAGALALVGALLLAGIVCGIRLENEYLHRITPELARAKDPQAEHSQGLRHLERVKDQGLALQRLAFRQPDLLPLYGSSELMKPIPDKASVFFQNYPSGFTVFPVGKAGATSLILLQKIAAAAPVRGSKVAISLSPGWFLNPPDAHYYAGNFSAQQALATAFEPRLSFGLKRDLARRFLDYPHTLERQSLLRFTAGHLARAEPLDRALYYFTLPLGLIQNAIDTAQDHFETAFYLVAHRNRWEPEPERRLARLPWDRLIAEAAAASEGDPAIAPSPAHQQTDDAVDAAFTESLATAREWEDLELLVRLLKELHLKPLLLSMPPNGRYLEQQGISAAAIRAYSERLRRLGREHDVLVESFEDHVEDPAFLVDHHDHLSPKGWMYYNRALDEFYHASPKHLIAHRRTKPHGA